MSVLLNLTDIFAFNSLISDTIFFKQIPVCVQLNQYSSLLDNFQGRDLHSSNKMSILAFKLLTSSIGLRSIIFASSVATTADACTSFMHWISAARNDGHFISFTTK